MLFTLGFLIGLIIGFIALIYIVCWIFKQINGLLKLK